MRNVLGAIGRLLAAIPAVLFVWVVEAGRLVMKVLRPAPDPMALAADYASAAETNDVSPAEVARKPDAVADDKLARIQAIAESMFYRRNFDASLFDGLAPRTEVWLATLDADMLLLVAKSTPEQLRDHMKGKKSIRGLLAYGVAEVAAYRAAMERHAGEYEHIPAPRRTRKEPLLPAFGPIC